MEGPSDIVTESVDKGNLKEIFQTRVFPLVTSHFTTQAATFF